MFCRARTYLLAIRLEWPVQGVHFCSQYVKSLFVFLEVVFTQVPARMHTISASRSPITYDFIS
jgi:hypothetical protein